MIGSFRDRDTRSIFEGADTKGARRRLPPRLWSTARAKMDAIDAATDIGQLATPSNRLNPQYRVCFEWKDGDAWEVEITDYH